jgi:hypothetical protein
MPIYQARISPVSDGQSHSILSLFNGFVRSIERRRKGVRDSPVAGIRIESWVLRSTRKSRSPMRRPLCGEVRRDGPVTSLD